MICLEFRKCNEVIYLNKSYKYIILGTFTVNNIFRRFGAYLVVVPFTTIVFALSYGILLPFGPLGVIGFAFVGVLWALFLGFIAKRLMRREVWGRLLANAPVFLGIIATGLLMGGGFIYIFMMNAALDEPSTTYAVLSALMRPAVPYYIVLNSLMELFIIPFVVFFNWDRNPKRRTYVTIGVILFLVMRVWTYLVFAATRLEISERALLPADVEWFKQTLATHYRVILILLTQAFFILAAFIPGKEDGKQENRN
jgi:hypothetical protein